MTHRQPSYFFVHLQKTAGTTMWRRLRHHFGETAVYPNAADGDDVVELVLSIERLREQVQIRGHEIEVITGHFPLCTTELLGGGFTTFTVLREPVARTLSYLRHHRENALEDRDKSLEEIYDDPFRFHGLAHNHMTKMFSLTTDEMDAGMLTQVEFTPERLQRAKSGLATVDAIGLQEHYEEFCEELCERFGWDLGRPEFANRTEPVEVTEGFRERIAADNAIDIELYRFAEQLCAHRSRSSHS